MTPAAISLLLVHLAGAARARGLNGTGRVTLADLCPDARPNGRRLVHWQPFVLRDPEAS